MTSFCALFSTKFWFTYLLHSHHNKSRKLAQNWNFLSKTLILGREKARKGKIALQKWKNNYLSFHTVLVSLQSLAKYRRYEHFKNKASKKIMFLVIKQDFFFKLYFSLLLGSMLLDKLIKIINFSGWKFDAMMTLICMPFSLINSLFRCRNPHSDMWG